MLLIGKAPVCGDGIFRMDYQFVNRGCLGMEINITAWICYWKRDPKAHSFAFCAISIININLDENIS